MMKPGFFLLVLATAAGATQAPRDAVEIQRDVMIPMRDGVRLAADIYRPAGSQGPGAKKLPVLLQRTPYDKAAVRLAEHARFFAGRGYVVVVQDARGRYRSEGEFTKYIGEGKDGYDTVEWLAALPYAEPKIGMWGTSYAAHVQANAAKLTPPHLSTLVLNMGGMSNGWDHKIRNHGAFEMQQLTWAFSQLAAESSDPIVLAALKNERVADWLTVFPLRKGLNPLSISPNFEDYILEMMTRSDYDSYWKQLDINWVEYYDQTADIPMIHVTGWYDSYCGGSILNYVRLAKLKRSTQRLWVGPWTHGGNSRSYAGEVEFGPAAAVGDFERQFHLRWFDHYLKGADASPDTAQGVRIFVMGSGDGHRDKNGRLYHGGYWRDGSQWPLTGTRFTPYYFQEGGGLSPVKPVPKEASASFTFDPKDPVPTLGGSFSSTSPVFESGAYDQREREGFFPSRPPFLPLKSRHDVLVFQTEPLSEDVEVIGPIQVRLFASSTAPDTDFTVKLVDVYPPSRDFPNGFEMNLTDGILRARYRNSPERQELMERGRVYEMVIEPFPTANRFKKGHRIRVDISSSNFPRFDVNPNTGDPLGTVGRIETAVNAVYFDRDRPSHILLPVVPAASGGGRAGENR